MKNILILSAGRRVELVKSFQEELGKRMPGAKVYTTDLRPEISPACHASDGAIAAPRVSAPEYIDFLLAKCKLLSIGLVIPTIDTELLVLSRNKKLFDAAGISLVISDEPLVGACRDKRVTGTLFQQMGIATPAIFSARNIEYPCFAKPYDGSCSKGATVVNSPEFAETLASDEKMMFMELVDQSFSEYTVDLYYDRRHQLKCMVPRERIEIRAGEVSKGVSRRNFVYEFLLPALISLPGARGCVTLQLFAKRESAKYFAIEINPRFGGGYPLAYSAGANFPGWLIDEYLFDKEIAFFDKWEADLMMLRYDAKVLVHGAA